MINVRSKRCSHYLCTKHPSFNVGGSRTAAFCKTHAQDGMVDVLRKRCSHDFCTMKPSFCMEGSRTALYCIQHAGDHMVDVVNKRRSHNSCTKFPSFNVEGKKYRGILQETRSKRHGKRPYQAFINYFPERSARGVLHNVEISASTMLNTDLMDKSRIHVRKRSRCTRQPPHPFGHVPLKRGLVEPAGMVPSIDVSPDLSSRAFRSEVTDDTCGTAAKQTRHKVPEVLAPKSGRISHRRSHQDGDGAGCLALA